MTVVDAGVVVAALSDDGDHGRAVRRRLPRDDDLHTPEMLDVEVTAVLRRLLIERKLTIQRAEQALRGLMDLPLIRWPHLPLVWRAWGYGTTSVCTTGST
ncbi:MAG: PIN domain-containing protein [Egibacteraceae bacterium]